MSPGFSLRPKAEQAEVKRGRPKVQAAEGSLGLGEKRPRSCSSYRKLDDAQRIQELERKVELLALNNAQGSAKDDERIDKVMRMNAQVEDENKKLREQLFKRKSSFETPRNMKNGSFETPDRKPSRGEDSPRDTEIPCEGTARFGCLGGEFGQKGGEFGEKKRR